MKRLVLSIFIAAGLFASLMAAAAPVGAQPTVPSVLQIEDPAGDANFINDGNDSRTGPVGRDHVTPVDASSAGDLLRIWFSNTSDKVSVHIETEAPPPTSNAVGFQVFTNPGEGAQGSSTIGCLRWLVIIPGTGPGGGSYQGEPLIKLHDRCSTGGSFFDAPDGEFVVEPTGGAGITTMTFDRSISPLLGSGSSLSAPYVIAISPQAGSTAVGFSNVLTIDNTQVGTDYVLADGGEVGPPKDPPGKDDPPGKGKKKGCEKGKGKKKGACPGKKKRTKPPTLTCAPYVPGEEGAEAETTVVTDEATEEKPVELTFDAPPGMGNDLGLGQYDGTESLYHNVQVDTKNADAGLFVRYEFPDRHDYDLYLNYPDGSSAAFAGDANAAPGEGLGSAEGGSSGTNFEQVEGIRTADCGGYTARLVSYLTTGGETTLKIWLGEVQNEPAAPSGEGLVATVFGLF